MALGGVSKVARVPFSAARKYRAALEWLSLKLSGMERSRMETRAYTSALDIPTQWLSGGAIGLSYDNALRPSGGRARRGPVHRNG